MVFDRRRAFDIGVAVAFLVVALILAGTNLSFGVKLVVAIGLILGSSLLARELQFSWSHTVKLLGWSMLMLVVVNSGIGRAAFALVNAVDNRVGAAVDDGSVAAMVDGRNSANPVPECPREGQFEIVEYDKLYTLVKGCKHRFVVNHLPHSSDGQSLFGWDTNGQDYAVGHNRKLAGVVVRLWRTQDDDLYLEPIEDVWDEEDRNTLTITFCRKVAGAGVGSRCPKVT